MDTSSKTVLLSASIVILVAQSMAVAAKEHPASISVPQVGDISHVGGLEAFSMIEVRQAVGKALPEVAARFQRDGVNLFERYQVAQSNGGDFVDGGGIGNPSPPPGEVACHSACHNAGGWC